MKVLPNFIQERRHQFLDHGYGVVRICVGGGTEMSSVPERHCLTWLTRMGATIPSRIFLSWSVRRVG